MLKVYRISDEEYWVVPARKEPLIGGLARTVDNMSKLGVEDHEIENGLVSLQLNDHQVADYGINLMFIYSEKLGQHRTK